MDLAVPEYVIGRSTMESIQSGTVYGFVGMIDSIVYRMQKEMKSKARVIGTGGLIGVIAEQVESIEEVDDF